MSLSLKVPLCPGGAKTKAFQHVRTRQTNCDDNMRARAKGTFTNCFTFIRENICKQMAFLKVAIRYCKNFYVSNISIPNHYPEPKI